MAQSKIQQDRYTLYVRSGGHLFRPVATQFRIGQVVRVSRVKGTPLARVARGGQEELWHSHGVYLDTAGRRIDSEYLYLGADFNPLAPRNSARPDVHRRESGRDSDPGASRRIPSSDIEEKEPGEENRPDARYRLHEAVQTGDVAEVRRLLEQGESVHQEDEEGCTPLALAAASGETDILALLLARGAADTSNALAITAGLGHISALRLLLEYGLDANTADDEGHSVLMLTAEEDQAASLRLLLEYGADINAQNVEGVSALMFAVQNGALRAAKLLLQWGADVHATDKEARTALCLAAARGCIESTTLLLEQNAAIHAADHEGWTALTHAAFRGHIEIVQCLLERGADLHARDDSGHNAAYWAAIGGHLDTLRLLLKRGAEADPVGDGILLTIAALENHTEIAQLLQEAGAAIGLLEAAMIGDIPTIRALVRQGEEIEKRDWDGHTPLAWAAMRGHAEVIRLLAEAGANIEARNHRGDTPLILAAREGRGAALEVLLALGSNVHADNDEGRTPLMQASLCGHEEAVYLLREHERALQNRGQADAADLERPMQTA